MELVREIADRVLRVDRPSQSKQLIIERSNLRHATRLQNNIHTLQTQGKEAAMFKPLLPKDFPNQRHAEADPVHQTRFLTACAVVVLLTLVTATS